MINVTKEAFFIFVNRYAKSKNKQWSTCTYYDEAGNEIAFYSTGCLVEEIDYKILDNGFGDNINTVSIVTNIMNIF